METTKQTKSGINYISLAITPLSAYPLLRKGFYPQAKQPNDGTISFFRWRVREWLPYFPPIEVFPN